LPSEPAETATSERGAFRLDRNDPARCYTWQGGAYRVWFGGRATMRLEARFGPLQLLIDRLVNMGDYTSFVYALAWGSVPELDPEQLLEAYTPREVTDAARDAVLAAMRADWDLQVVGVAVTGQGADEAPGPPAPPSTS
jgi:hypothetical protein